MATLEEEVRDGLRRKKTEEVIRFLQNPDYQAKVKVTIRTGLQSLLDAFVQEADGPTEEEKEEAMKSVDEQLNKLYSDQDSLRKQAESQGMTYYATREEMEKKIEPLYQLIQQGGDFNETALAELRRANERLYQSLEQNKRIVTGLVAVAREKGIEHALTDEAEHAVLCQTFPRKEDYLTHFHGSLQALKEWGLHVREAMLMDGQTGKVMASIIGKLMTAMQETYQKTLEEETVKQLQERATKIYG